MATVRVCSKLKTRCVGKSVFSLFFFTIIVGQNSQCFVGVFNETVIPLALVGYEMIIADKALYPPSHIQQALVE